MTGSISTLYTTLSGVKQDFKVDWTEKTKADWKVDWNVTGTSYADVAPVNTVPVSIAGSAIVGQTLTATPGTWTGSPAPVLTYQWRNDNGNIAGATGSTYVLQATDTGFGIAVVETATNVAGIVNARSNILGPVAVS